MKRVLLAAACALATTAGGMLPATAGGPAQTATASDTETGAVVQSRTFAIENMTCALCPVTVKKAMQQVDGVQSVAIDFDAKTATVVFDPARTSVDAIAAASTNAGYPAAVQG